MRKKLVIIPIVLVFLQAIFLSSLTYCAYLAENHMASNQNSIEVTIATVPHFRNELRRDIELADKNGRLAGEQMYTYLDFKYGGKLYSAWWKSRTTPAPVELVANVKYKFVLRLTEDRLKCDIVAISRGEKMIWNNPRFEK